MESSDSLGPDRCRLEVRSLRYAARVLAGEVPHRADGDTQAQAENYRRAMARVLVYETAARQVLACCGVMPVRYGDYLAFCRQMAAVWRRAKGEPLQLQAACCLARWVGEGLRRDVLDRLLAQVFSLEVPLVGQEGKGV
jgi:hypothetical protein